MLSVYQADARFSSLKSGVVSWLAKISLFTANAERSRNRPGISEIFFADAS
jgi:hypothetical protein